VLVSDFHFDLPEELIAQHPPAVRGASRMLVVERQGTGNREQQGALIDAQFRDLPDYLRAGDLLILNDSRVLPARLFATRAGLATQANSPVPSGVIEVLLTEEVEPLVWRALVKPARKVRVGETLHFYGPDSGLRGEGPGLKPFAIEPDYRGLKPAATPGDVARIPPKRSLDEAPDLMAEVLGVGEFGERTLRFAPVEDFYGTLGRIGHMPLPPYIHRDQAGEADSEEDRERYQTVYSQQVGSAAAPTAGLHFTPEVLGQLEARGVEVRYLTLHVGLGTFQPVRVSELKDIRLHAERYTLPAETAEALNRALAERRRIVAVGTTTTRTLEHIAARVDELVPGAKAHGIDGAIVPGLKSRPISEARPISEELPGKLEAHSGTTSIFLAPGHRFRIVSGLLTNFHLPESTLLMLVSAFAGREAVLAAYAHAIREGYKFYSYGDCMVIL
jgi:S-adenosylmethionine:tRNA ribosyltransferase-isomerase